MKRVLLIILLVVAVVGIWYAYKLYTTKVPSVTELKTDAQISAVDLIAAFEKNRASAEKIYLGKILAVSGEIKTVEDNGTTLVLGDPNNSSSVRCTMDSSFIATANALKAGNTVTVKGECIGFMADEMGMGLGSDVKLNRCVFENKQ